jgi:hypothetical protein
MFRPKLGHLHTLRKTLYNHIINCCSFIPTRRWEDNIKLDLQDVGWEGWIDLAQNTDRWRALVNAVTKLRVTYS